MVYDVMSCVGTTLPLLFTCFNTKRRSVLPILCVYMFYIFLTIIMILSYKAVTDLSLMETRNVFCGIRKESLDIILINFF